MGNIYSEPTEVEEVTEVTDVTTEGSDNGGSDNAGEKQFSQADLDRIVKARVREERNKFSDYDEIKSALNDAKNNEKALAEISDVLKNGAGISGTPAEQVEALRSYYGLSKSEAKEVVKAVHAQDDDTTEAVAFYKAEKFAKKLNNEETVEEYERISEIPKNKRSALDNAKLEAMQDRYSRLMFNKEVNEARSWYEKEVDGQFDDVMKDKDFINFAKNSKQNLKDAMKTYLNLVGKNTKKTANPGSAKTTGSAKAKDYYTPEEVDKLTSKQLDDPKILAAVKKSMTKW